MKRYIAWMLIALIALLPAAGMAAENRSTQLVTTLPREHTITVVCGAGGAARVGGTIYTGTRVFTVERLSAFALEAVPDAGYRFNQVQAQPSGGASISGNTVTIGSVYEDKTLTLSFVREQEEPTPSPTPTASPTPSPTHTPTSTTKPTASPSPTVSVSPTTTADVAQEPDFDLPAVASLGNVLYDEYLGTGGGLSELGIVYDETYELDEYELVAVVYDATEAAADAEAQAVENMLLVIAPPDETGGYAQHSLILSGLQLARLWQESDIRWIELRNGDASALVRLEELLSGNAAKLIHMYASGEPVLALSDLEALPEVELSTDDLARVAIEVRIVPPSVEQDGYKMDVYLWDADAQLCMTELLKSFHVGLTANELADDAVREEYLKAHALGAMQEDGTITVLPSALLRMPKEAPQEEKDTAEYFAVSFENEERNAVVLYDLAASMETYRWYALYAEWPGEMAICIIQSETD